MPAKKAKIEKQGWYKPKITESSGNVLWGLKLARENRLYHDLIDISNSKNTPYKQELFSNLLRNSGHSQFRNEENVKKISNLLSQNDVNTAAQLRSVFIAGGEEKNNVVKTLLRKWTLSLPKRQNRTEWMLLNDYKNVSRAFISELYKNDYLRGKIEETLKPQQSEPHQAPVQEAQERPTKSKKSKTYKIINRVYGNVYGNVGKNVGGGTFTFGGEVKKPEQDEKYKKMMESILSYNVNLAEHLKTLKQEFGRPVERTAGGFEFVSYEKPEKKPEGKQAARGEVEQLGFGLKEKNEGQLELPFNKLNELINRARENPEKLSDLYNFNSKPAREEFDRMLFENEPSDQLQYNALKVLLKHRDFDRMARAVKSDNWGILKLEALEHIGSTINEANKDKAVGLFSDLLSDKDVDEYYLTIHKTLDDKVKNQKLRNYIFERLRQGLADAEDRMKLKMHTAANVSPEIKGLGEEALEDFLKPPEEVNNKKAFVEPDFKELRDYEAVRKELALFIKNSKKERET